MQIARSGGAAFDVSGKNARQREIAGEVSSDNVVVLVGCAGK